MAGLRAVRYDHMKCGCEILRVENNETGERVGQIDEQCSPLLPTFIGILTPTVPGYEDHEFLGEDIGEIVAEMARALNLNESENG